MNEQAFLSGWYAREFGMPLLNNPWNSQISREKHVSWNAGWIDKDRELTIYRGICHDSL